MSQQIPTAMCLQDMLEEVDECDSELTKWEIDFVSSLLDSCDLERLTNLQTSFIINIHEKYCS